MAALAAATVLGGASVAVAADSGSGSSSGSGTAAGHARPQLTDDQKQCLSDALSAAGITLPQKPADGQKPTDGTRPQLTQEQRDAMKAAAEKCGLPAMGPRGAQGGQSGQSV